LLEILEKKKEAAEGSPGMLECRDCWHDGKRGRLVGTNTIVVAEVHRYEGWLVAAACRISG